MIDYTNPDKNRKSTQKRVQPENQKRGPVSMKVEGDGTSTIQHKESRSASAEHNILRNVYSWMTIGLLITGTVAWFVANSPTAARILFNSEFAFFGIFIAQLIFVFVLSAKILTLKPQTAVLLFIGYAALMGLTLSSIFLVYEIGTISLAFFTTAGMFGGMSLWAITTKKDLSGWGNYLLMGLWGIVISSIINIFVGSDAFSYFISYIGVGVFLGLTAYDTFVIKKWYQEMADRGDEKLYTKLSILGALKLYLDFINLFLYALRLLSRKR